MSTVIVALAGAACGLGVLRLRAAYAASPIDAGHARRVAAARLRALDRAHALRIAASLGAGVAALAVLGWPVVSLGVAVATWAGAGLMGAGAGGVRRDERALVEAIAQWTEQLRDTIAGSHGLEQAIVATAAHAPAPLAAPVRRLAAGVAYGRLGAGLRRLADEVAHPTMDFVCAALLAASEHRARELGALLGRLADCARDEGRMRTRVWVGRARTRSAVRIISGVVAAFVLGLLAFHRDYLAVYATWGGQLILCGILAAFVGALVALGRMSHIDVPDRFVRRRAGAVPA